MTWSRLSLRMPPAPKMPVLLLEAPSFSTACSWVGEGCPERVHSIEITLHMLRFQQLVSTEVLENRQCFEDGSVSLKNSCLVLDIISEGPYVPEDQDWNNVSDVRFGATFVFLGLNKMNDVIGLGNITLKLGSEEVSGF
ncbi:UNVERIFIED_CONTAM: hypothetical protein Slati_2509200 [Sesamum latifolium]|uniref:Uncharacterized protein n=1 Tax=Sesamum latifolium TaxID=2727402 RepID=A0AAW2WEQ7_9LAMI